MTLPTTEYLLLDLQGPFLHVTLNRPQARNALSLGMASELMQVFDAVRNDESIRALVIRGAEGHFCAGGDIKDMAGARAALAAGDEDAMFKFNRGFGEMITACNELPQTVITVIEGAALGGGFGLACVSDIAIAHADATFGLPETGLGVIPAQIAPFVVKRIGLTQTRRLALTGIRFKGHEAQRLGIVHEVADSDEELQQRLDATLNAVKRCGPHANRVTKQLILNVERTAMSDVLDQAARAFADATQSAEGQEGTMAFVQKRLPEWAQ